MSYALLALAIIAVVTGLGLLIAHSAKAETRLAEAQLKAVQVPEPPEPRVPADTSRMYPRPKGSRSKLNRVCPVCGTGAETTELDGRVLGWPAHASCVEWLGDWKPAMFQPLASVKPPASIQPGNGSEAVWCANGTAATLVFATKDAVPVTAGSAATNAIFTGMVREHLNREIVAAWGVPPVMLQEHVHNVGDPAPSEQCPKCGAKFLGTPDYLRQAFKMHQQVDCRQSSSSPDA